MDINHRADSVAQKIKHFMITTNGRTTKTATVEEFYQAFCSVLKEELMLHWTATLESIDQKKVRMVNFLSMEYLPGRFLRHNIVNLQAKELVKAVLKKLDRTLSEIEACETDAGLGNGGLGRLSSCFLDSLATQHYPARGYGLRYQYGIFEQEIRNGRQVERPDCWLLNMNPWEARRDGLSTTVHLGGHPIEGTNQQGEKVFLLEGAEEVRALPYDTPIVGYNEGEAYSVVSLRLWSTKESPRNFSLQRYNAGLLESAVENTSLTDVLYPNDNTELGKRVRLKQEFLLVSASMQDILRRHMRVHGDMASLGDKARIQINDTHPALIIAELVRALIKNYDFSWQKAWETCQECCSYTNHTILREGLEEWNQERVKELLPRQYHVIERLNQQLCDVVRSKFPGDEEKVQRLSILQWDQIRMAHLAIFGSHKVNGVAELHTELLKKYLFTDFFDLFPEKFMNVTNGITQRRWLLDANPSLAEFISQRIGREWICDFSHIAKLHEFAADQESQDAFLRIKQENKKVLLRFLNEENPRRDETGKMIPSPCYLCETALFDVHIKRMHEYKRQLLNALHLIFVYLEIKEGRRENIVPRLAIFGGKAAPGYEMAKFILQFICAIGKKFENDPAIRDKLGVIFIENYNVSRAEILIPAADLSEQISTAGWEASGTGNMKLSINGALTIGTEDGANIEMHAAATDAWWPFSFGADVLQNQQEYHPKEVYEKDPELKRVLDTMVDGTFAETEEEAQNFAKIYHHILDRDPYRLLQDFRSYYETQKKVETLYREPRRWAEFAIHNIASMGAFSVDYSIQSYAHNIWQIEPAPPDPQVLEKVREEYFEHDRCRIKE